MKNIVYKIACSLLFVVVFASCEDFDNPIDGIDEANLFVQFTGNTPDTVNVSEGDEAFSFTIEAPISMGDELQATIAFSSSAAFTDDFTVSSVDGTEDLVQSSSSTEAVIRLPLNVSEEDQSPLEDYASVSIGFPTDGAADGDKELIITLTGATGVTDKSIQLVGGRGPIRKVIVVNIEDVD